MNVSDFTFHPSKDPETEDDEYIHREDRRLRIQAQALFGGYFCPFILLNEGEDNMAIVDFDESFGTLEEAVESLAQHAERRWA